MAIVVDRKTKLAYDDYLQFPEDGRRSGSTSPARRVAPAGRYGST